MIKIYPLFTLAHVRKGGTDTHTLTTVFAEMFHLKVSPEFKHSMSAAVWRYKV